MFDFPLLTYAVAQLEWVQYARWALCVVITCVLAWVMWRQNARYRGLVDESPHQGLAALFNLARVRGVVALMLWVLICAVMVFRDIEMEVNRVQQAGHRVAGASAIMPEPPTFQAQQDNAAPVDAEQQLATIKASYEDAFISYMILDGCKQGQVQDYEAIYVALMQTVSPFDASGKEAGNIVIAASGSYQALYRSAPCDASYLDPVKENLAHFMKIMGKN